jgi:glutamate transport system permease protein
VLDILSQYNNEILAAFWITIQLSVFAAIGSLVLGTGIAVLRVSPVRTLNLLGAGYVNTVRNTPLTLLMVSSILGASFLMGIRLSPDITTNAFRWAIVMLSLYHAAYVGEALRSGVNTVPAGQAEAARSIGLTFGQSLREVILPQAFRGAIAPLGSTLVALIKNTTVAALIGVADAASLLRVIVENETGSFEVFGIFAIGFVVLTLPVGLLFTALSRRMAVLR